MAPGEIAERELVVAARAGDRRALDRFVERFDPLVARIARRLHSPGGAEDLEDLIQVGRIGLLEALARFDPERGSFGPYASVTISGTIKRHFRDHGWKLRIPRSLHDAAQLVAAASLEMEGRLARRPTDVELAAEIHLELALVREALALLAEAQPLSLQGSVDPEAGSLGESIGGDDENFDRADQRGGIGRLTAELSQRDRQVLALRFGLDHTQLEIAELIGVSQMQVSRLLRRALAQMRSEAALGQ